MFGAIITMTTKRGLRIALVASLAMILLLPIGLSDLWSSHDRTEAKAVVGTAGTLDTSLERNLHIADDGSVLTKETTSSLVATGAKGIEYQTSNQFTRSINGETTTTKSSTAQQLSLPDNSQFNVAMEQNSFTDFSDLDDPLTELGSSMKFWNGDQEASDLFSLISDPSDTTNDLINKFLANFGDAETGMMDTDKLQNLQNFQLGLAYDHMDTAARNGMTCTWGTSQNIAIDYSKLADI